MCSHSHLILPFGPTSRGVGGAGSAIDPGNWPGRLWDKDAVLQSLPPIASALTVEGWNQSQQKLKSSRMDGLQRNG